MDDDEEKKECTDPILNIPVWSDEYRPRSRSYFDCDPEDLFASQDEENKPLEECMSERGDDTRTDTHSPNNQEGTKHVVHRLCITVYYLAFVSVNILTL